MRTYGLNTAFAHGALARYTPAHSDRSLRFPPGWWMLPAVAFSLVFWVWAGMEVARLA
jgi:hypothetical protein